MLFPLFANSIIFDIKHFHKKFIIFRGAGGRLSRSRNIMAVVDEFWKSGFTCFDRNYSTCHKPRGGRTNRGKMTGTCFPNGSKRIHESINTRYNTINRNAMNLHCVSKRKSEILRAIIESSFRYKR